MYNFEEKLKKVAIDKKTSIRQIILHIGMTENGFYKMLKNDSVKVETLERICDFLNIPVTYFFSEDNLVNEPVETYQKTDNQDKMIIEYQKKIIELQEKIIQLSEDKNKI